MPGPGDIVAALDRLTAQVRRVADAAAGEGLPPVTRDSYLTLSQLAKRTGYHRNTLYEYVRRKNDPMPAKRAPGATEIRVRWGDFEDWLEDYRGDVEKEAKDFIMELVS